MIVEDNSSVFSLIQTHCSHKILQLLNPPVVNWRCWLTQVDVYTGHKTIVVVAYWKRTFENRSVTFMGQML